jgi:hypothetical protein
LSAYVVAAIDSLTKEGRKVCETRAEGCRKNDGGLYNCNPAIQSHDAEVRGDKNTNY